MEPVRQRKKWGGRTQWSKTLFTMLPDPTDGADSTHSGAITMKPKKQRKKDEMAATTRWQCTRCQAIVHPPMDAHTHRPCLSVLADHLEGRSTSRAVSASAGGSTDALPLCTAGTFLTYSALDDAVKGESEGEVAGQKRSRGEHGAAGQPSPCAPRTPVEVGTHADADASRAQLEALLFPADSATSSSPRVFIVVENPKTPRNVGSILRAMHNYGCDVASLAHGTASDGALLYSGTRLDKALAFAGAEALVTDTVDGAVRIPRLGLPSLQLLFDVLLAHTCAATNDDHRDRDAHSRHHPVRGRCPLFSLVAVDLIEKATCLPFFTHPFTVTHAANGCVSHSTCTPVHTPLVFYLFGPEDGTLSECFLRQCDAAVYMPTIASMNLAASVNVLLYDRTAKAYLAAEDVSAEGSASYQRVFSARNANNRLKWDLPEAPKKDTSASL